MEIDAPQTELKKLEEFSLEPVQVNREHEEPCVDGARVHVVQLVIKKHTAIHGIFTSHALALEGVKITAKRVNDERFEEKNEAYQDFMWVADFQQLWFLRTRKEFAAKYTKFMDLHRSCLFTNCITIDHLLHLNVHTASRFIEFERQYYLKYPEDKK